jgi:hypothetical protein
LRHAAYTVRVLDLFFPLYAVTVSYLVAPEHMAASSGTPPASSQIQTGGRLSDLHAAAKSITVQQHPTHSNLTTSILV